MAPAGDQFDMFPVSPKGVRAMADYLGSSVAPGVPVRMTGPQYRNFMVHLHERKYGAFSVGLQRQYRGQRLPSASDLAKDLSPQVSDRCTFGRTVYVEGHNFTVACARYGPSPEGQIYKVTEAKYAPSASLSLSIGTLDYYRDVVDKDEGSFSSESDKTVLHTLDGKLLAGPGTIGNLRFSIDPCWVYCTTMISGHGMRPDQSSWFKADHRATPVASSPNHFARMLGAAFGVWSIPRIRQVYEWIESVPVLEYTHNAIMIVHGAVRYMDAAERDRYLGTLSQENRELWMHEAVFTKNAEFAPEREYRFAIWGWGTPLQDHVVMPLTNQLLDSYGPSVAVSDLELVQA